MYKFFISEKLEKIFKKLIKKDKTRYETILKKIDEIINSNPNHYKNLRKNMKDFKRVHIDSHFVLIFKIKQDKIYFEDLQHHDYIYKS
jgi:YafQ family addiction module toxin component